jgi:hypothetical protein
MRRARGSLFGLGLFTVRLIFASLPLTTKFKCTSTRENEQDALSTPPRSAPDDPSHSVQTNGEVSTKLALEKRRKTTNHVRLFLLELFGAPASETGPARGRGGLSRSVPHRKWGDEEGKKKRSTSLVETEKGDRTHPLDLDLEEEDLDFLPESEEPVAGRERGRTARGEEKGGGEGQSGQHALYEVLGVRGREEETYRSCWRSWPWCASGRRRRSWRRVGGKRREEKRVSETFEAAKARTGRSLWV